MASSASEPAKPAAETPAAPATPATPAEKPLSIKIGDAEFTPGGFLDVAHVYRTTNVGSGMPTAFNAIPYSNTAAGKMPESRFGAQASRISLKITSQKGDALITGFVEGDFLGTASDGVNVTSNSSSLRIRQYWIDVQKGKLEFLAGQAWGLLTPNLSGLSSNPISTIFLGQGVEFNYLPGLTWTRSAQARVIVKFTKQFSAALSLENADQYTGNVAVLPAFAASQFDNGANPRTPSVHPDIVAKVAWEGRLAGRAYHFEAGGLMRSFAATRPDDTKAQGRGFGGAFNGNFELTKRLRAVFTTYYSSGGGRYILAIAPDLVVRSNGDISPVKSGSAVAGLECRVTPASTIYGYYSSIYVGRNFSLDSAGKYLGYGFPGASLAANRQIQQYSGGYNYMFWKSPTMGSLQFMNQYSYVQRAPWSPAPTGPRNAHTHMVQTGLMYVLP